MSSARAHLVFSSFTGLEEEEEPEHEAWSLSETRPTRPLGIESIVKNCEGSKI